MKNKFSLSSDELALFKEAIRGAKKLMQDKVVHPTAAKAKIAAPKRLRQEQIDASFYFSDEFQPRLSDDGPIRYSRPDFSHYEFKKLRRGNYLPELFLDLHGLTQLQAKQELGALIAACRREHIYCTCVMTGHGKHILKRQVPLWLAQHPDVLAFHQAPKEFGGDAALLVLIELKE